ncbi:hypothetical protein SAMN05421839_1453 [Halolactibacillus halophilus]|uniref:Uncharacterized protein n=2 Tax=Halolactibacillus halophilus TaxID=306540 RepID=A0A1I5SIM6_9BACI|nr:hypothetical protein HHA03_21230 [Halolactibacillus halophilus]SFP70206.1 hypothetical protein SAMN05421839_1453 [Halolactibacillus halophilus]
MIKVDKNGMLKYIFYSLAAFLGAFVTSLFVDIDNGFNPWPVAIGTFVLITLIRLSWILAGKSTKNK